MEKTLEKLWNEYFANECAAIDTANEKALVKKAANMHDIAVKLLSSEQREALENYVDLLCEIQDFLVKKAFFKGCKFTTSFLFATRDF
ncbi:MAG: hypothetical protein IJY65_00545 [Clostridia bacterium]|nr:hypothetical protein [Clostridia bacterium]